MRLLTFSPFSLSSPQPMTAVQTITVSPSSEISSTTLAISSPGPLGAISISDSDGVRPVDPAGNSLTLPLPAAASPVRIAEVSRQLLQERNLTVSVTMPSRPRADVRRHLRPR